MNFILESISENKQIIETIDTSLNNYFNNISNNNSNEINTVFQDFKNQNIKIEESLNTITNFLLNYEIGLNKNTTALNDYLTFQESKPNLNQNILDTINNFEKYIQNNNEYLNILNFNIKELINIQIKNLDAISSFVNNSSNLEHSKTEPTFNIPAVVGEFQANIQLINSKLDKLDNLDKLDILEKINNIDTNLNTLTIFENKQELLTNINNINEKITSFKQFDQDTILNKIDEFKYIIENNISNNEKNNQVDDNQNNNIFIQNIQSEKTDLEPESSIVAKSNLDIKQIENLTNELTNLKTDIIKKLTEFNEYEKNEKLTLELNNITKNIQSFDTILISIDKIEQILKEHINLLNNIETSIKTEQLEPLSKIDGSSKPNELLKIDENKNNILLNNNNNVTENFSVKNQNINENEFDKAVLQQNTDISSFDLLLEILGLIIEFKKKLIEFNSFESILNIELNTNKLVSLLTSTNLYLNDLSISKNNMGILPNSLNTIFSNFSNKNDIDQYINNVSSTNKNSANTKSSLDNERTRICK